MTTETKTVLTPGARWAQRNNVLMLTVTIVDCQKPPTVKLEPTTFNFSGIAGDKKEYGLNVELYGEIDPEASTYTVLGREIEFNLKKAKDGFWPRFTKATTKQHWLSIDFGKWKDEDELSEDEDGGMGGMPGMGGMGGMPGMGGMGGMPGMGGMGGMGGDMDFQKMMAEMGGLGGGGGKASMDDLGDEPETDSDDEEALPELE